MSRLRIKCGPTTSECEIYDSENVDLCKLFGITKAVITLEPNSILAEYLSACLDAFDSAVIKRAEYYGG